jgi:hypothetical protein
MHKLKCVPLDTMKEECRGWFGRDVQPPVTVKGINTECSICFSDPMELPVSFLEHATMPSV